MYVSFFHIRWWACTFIDLVHNIYLKGSSILCICLLFQSLSFYPLTFIWATHLNILVAWHHFIMWRISGSIFFTLPQILSSKFLIWKWNVLLLPTCPQYIPPTNICHEEEIISVFSLRLTVVMMLCLVNVYNST